MVNIISKICCPRCQSSKIYKFGKDLLGHQKYQCKDCKRQFTTESLNSRSDSKYPKCPVCNKASFIHHDYKHYTNYRCGDKKCYHSFFVYKATSIDLPSCCNISGKTDFKRMRFNMNVILTALNLFFLNKSSSRDISLFLLINHSISVSHVTICEWTKKFTPLFNLLSQKYLSSINLDSDEWHVDETAVKINGIKHWVWFTVDSETRFIISYHLSPFRSSDQAFSNLANSLSLGHPNAIVSDGLPSYCKPIKTIFPTSKHIVVESFKDDISNNLIESFNNRFKSWYKTKLGFNSFNSANNLISMFVFFYNFIRPHSSLNKLTPAQVAGAIYSDKARNSWLLTG